MTDKVVDLAGAARLVSDGDHVAIGGCLYSRTPWAMLLELLRAERRDLTLSRCLMCYEAELFLATGAAHTLVSSWIGIGLPWGIPKVFRAYVESGRANYEEWSHLSLGLRYQAAAMGVPFLPTMSLLGSDLLELSGAKVMDDPFTGVPVCLVPALAPDVALIHVQRADALGNAQIDGAPYMDRELAGAAKRVILTAEELVPAADIVATADRTAIPHFLVDAVVEVPFGSFPHECYGRYEASFEHFGLYQRYVDDAGEEGAREYVRRVVQEVGSFEGFLDQVGAEALREQQRRAEELVPVTASWSPEDAMIVAGSRLLADGDVVFAGVGAPLLASVLAQNLHAPGLTIVLEGGYIGPRMIPGKLPISTNEMRGAHGSSMLTGIVDVFLMAQGGHFDHGFVGAAQVDRFGNVNTSFIGPPDDPKVRLPGSGGANDIVSSCREIFIITKHERRRFVERVDFVTSPGYLDGGDARERAGLTRARPVAVITDLALLGFDPASKAMRLDGLQPGATVADVQANTGFELLVPATVPDLAPPSAEEMAVLTDLRDGPNRAADQAEQAEEEVIVG